MSPWVRSNLTISTPTYSHNFQHPQTCEYIQFIPPTTKKTFNFHYNRSSTLSLMKVFLGFLLFVSIIYFLLYPSTGLYISIEFLLIGSKINGYTIKIQCLSAFLKKLGKRKRMEFSPLLQVFWSYSFRLKLKRFSM